MQGTVFTDSQRQFAEDNHRLIYSFLQRYNFQHDEWYDVAAIGFCKAVRAFDPSRSRAFSTFAYHVMLNDVLMEMRKARNSKRNAVIVSLQSEVCDGGTLEDVLPLEPQSSGGSMVEIMDFIQGMKKEQQFIIASLAAGETQNEIAGDIGVTQSQVSRYVKAIRTKFKNEYLCGEGTVHV